MTAMHKYFDAIEEFCRQRENQADYLNPNAQERALDKLRQLFISQWGIKDEFNHIYEAWRTRTFDSYAYRLKRPLLEKSVVAERELKKIRRILDKPHICRSDEVWYAEDANGNAIGSKPRCPECSDGEQY